MSSAIESLVEKLTHPSLAICIHAATLLGCQGEESAVAVPKLIEMLASEDVRDVRMSCLALGNIGPAASDAIPALLLVMNDDEDEGVRKMAAEALEKIDGDDLRQAA